MMLQKRNDRVYSVDGRMSAMCLHLLVKAFAKPKDEQEEEVFFFSMMFLVIATGSGITLFFQVYNTQLWLIKEN